MYQWDTDNRTGYNNRIGRYRTNCELKFLLKYLGDTQLRILDVGGGSGRLSAKLKKLGHKTTIIDPNKEAIELAKIRGLNDSYCVYLEDFLEYNFDIILSIENINYIRNVDKFIGEISKRLNPGGYFIFTINNIKSWRYFLKNKLNKNSIKYEHKELDEYVKICKNNSMSIQELYGFNWMPFGVTSNNVLVPVFAKIESYLRLNIYIKQSPWVLISCKKSASIL